MFGIDEVSPGVEWKALNLEEDSVRPLTLKTSAGLKKDDSPWCLTLTSPMYMNSTNAKRSL